MTLVFNTGLSRLRNVLGSKSEELLIAIYFTAVCVLYGAVCIYFVEMAFVDDTEVCVGMLVWSSR